MRRAASRLSRAKNAGWAGTLHANKIILDQRGRGPRGLGKKMAYKKLCGLEGFSGFPWSYDYEPILFETGSLM